MPGKEAGLLDNHISACFFIGKTGILAWIYQHLAGRQYWDLNRIKYPV